MKTVEFSVCKASGCKCPQCKNGKYSGEIAYELTEKLNALFWSATRSISESGKPSQNKEDQKFADGARHFIGLYRQGDWSATPLNPGYFVQPSPQHTPATLFFLEGMLSGLESSMGESVRSKAVDRGIRLVRAGWSVREAAAEVGLSYSALQRNLGLFYPQDAVPDLRQLVKMIKKDVK